ncbi:hypothetical protein BA896_015275 [Janthinobacterium lividum]|uniref:Uncharacterized protein n=1 Tax=Janthinobacterium lividum TaxID=29581 RepID=A0A1E8PLM2_9BURK|nr:hypothetical protein BA896_015275 [Janthinobacterium lividum]
MLNLFDDLRQAGYFAVQDCTLKRQAAAGGGSEAPPTVGAECELLWLTLGSTAVPEAGRP